MLKTHRTFLRYSLKKCHFHGTFVLSELKGVFELQINTVRFCVIVVSALIA